MTSFFSRSSNGSNRDEPPTGIDRDQLDTNDTPGEYPLSESDLENLNSVLGHEIADNTKRTYKTQWGLFVEWARLKGVSPMPADPVHVAVYLAERLEVHGHKPATLRASAAAVSYAHRAAGEVDPCAAPEVKNALRSATRKVGREQRQAQALTADSLRQIRATAHLPRNLPRGERESVKAAARRALEDVAIISLMRDAMLRVSEAAALRWKDLEKEGDGTGRLLIRRSKTDVEGETAVLFVSQKTMADLEAIRPATEHDDASMFSLSAYQITRRIKNAALAAGLGEGYSGHSPRVGMAQDLARTGVELPSLMTAGRWRSPRMPAHYIRNETAARGAVARYYGFSLDRAADDRAKNDQSSNSRAESPRDTLQELGDSCNIKSRQRTQVGARSIEQQPETPITAIICLSHGRRCNPNRLRRKY